MVRYFEIYINIHVIFNIMYLKSLNLDCNILSPQAANWNEYHIQQYYIDCCLILVVALFWLNIATIFIFIQSSFLKIFLNCILIIVNFLSLLITSIKLIQWPFTKKSDPELCRELHLYGQKRSWTPSLKEYTATCSMWVKPTHTDSFTCISNKSNSSLTFSSLPL